MLPGNEPPDYWKRLGDFSRPNLQRPLWPAAVGKRQLMAPARTARRLSQQPSPTSENHYIAVRPEKYTYITYI